MLYPNPLKQKIQKGELILGTLLPALSNYITTLTCQTAIDFLWIDMEHAPEGPESLGAIPVLARHQGVAPLIRVAWNDPHLIKKAYDAGAVAVMVPTAPRRIPASRNSSLPGKNWKPGNALSIASMFFQSPPLSFMPTTVPP